MSGKTELVCWGRVLINTTELGRVVGNNRVVIFKLETNMLNPKTGPDHRI